MTTVVQVYSQPEDGTELWNFSDEEKKKKDLIQKKWKLRLWCPISLQNCSE